VRFLAARRYNDYFNAERESALAPFQQRLDATERVQGELSQALEHLKAEFGQQVRAMQAPARRGIAERAVLRQSMSKARVCLGCLCRGQTSGSDYSA
jgi:hypothetical protein